MSIYVGQAVGGAMDSPKQAEIVSFGDASAVRTYSIADALVRQGIHVPAPESSSPNLGAFNAASAGYTGASPAALVQTGPALSAAPGRSA